jgi:4-hydroxyphenylpyruvate dioxygenase
MLQIFQEELRHVEGKPDGSPAFYEVIQRAGDRGFGYGNFRALFEAIEAAQTHRAA